MSGPYYATLRRRAYQASQTFRWNRETGAEPIELKVFREDLEELGLKAGAAEFLEQHEDDEISLISVVEEHHADLMAFHVDFRDLVMDEYEDELEEYLEGQQRVNDGAREAFGTE